MLLGGSLVKKRRPSLLGLVRAERRDEIWWRTGVLVLSEFLGAKDGLVLVASVSV
jgi:hypothetical protein